MVKRRLSLATLFAIIVLLGSILSYGTANWGYESAPKLALDLEGGTQVILQAKANSGEAISAEQMEQARQIMSQRINAMGVAETEISVQGGSNIVVNVPGNLDQKTSEALRRTATMSFRPVLFEGAPTTPSSDTGQDATASASQENNQAPANAQEQNSGAKGINQYEGLKAWDQQRLAEISNEEFAAIDCSIESVRNEHDINQNPDEAVVACSADGFAKYVLGPVVITGEAIENATAQPEANPTGQPTGFYAVGLQFNSEAGAVLGEMNSALFSGNAATKQFAIILDSVVISAPEVQAVTTTESQITGRFNIDQAQELANQLKFGALPLEFTVGSEQQISASLGSDQLVNGLIAGLIGLALVIIYAFFQYRLLAIVTTLSLVFMGVLTYEIITLLSNIPEIGYRLSLAGVTGLIVAIAFTADSFIVYFERVRDEIRDGRGVVAAVDHGWARARQTIIASDAVNLIAAGVLYLGSAGSVRGFAFTLGLTTILDLVIVFLFTHPFVQTLVRTNFFGKGHPLSGLDPAYLGRKVPAYQGRGKFSANRSLKSKARNEQFETLAEKKARLASEAAAEREASLRGEDA